MTMKVESGSSMRLISSLFTCLMILVMLSGAATGTNTTKCPEVCVCYTTYHPTEGPAKGVKCNDGGMLQVPIETIEHDIFELTISADSYNPNFLTIGPIFTYPVIFINLRTLSITNSNIPVIGEHSFWGLQNLRALNLSSNHISNILIEDFRGLLNLTTLCLDYNDIENIATETFHYLSGLEQLSLTNNKISALVPRIFRMLGKLEKLDLSANPIEDLNPEIFKDIQNLRTFKCRSCNLSHINVQIYHIVPLLQELDLGNNLFKYLASDDLDNLKKLEKFSFDRNEISVILDNTFKENIQLKYLDISHNNIVLLPSGSLNNLTSLSHLDVSFNHLDKFNQQTFAPCAKSLKTINLSGNNFILKEIGALLEILPEIRSLGMANLSLKRLTPSFFVNSKHLTSLDMSSNMLEQFPLTLLKDTKYLQNLDLSHNNLTMLQEVHLRRLEAIAKVDLTLNTWNCDCSVKIVLIYMRTTVLNESLRVLQCYMPLKLHGVYFPNLTDSLLEPCLSSNDTQTQIAIGLSFFVSSILFTILMSVFWFKRCRRRNQKKNIKLNPMNLRSNANESSFSVPSGRES